MGRVSNHSTNRSTLYVVGGVPLASKASASSTVSIDRHSASELTGTIRWTGCRMASIRQLQWKYLHGSELSKMVVERERIDDFQSPHDDVTCAIGETPQFVHKLLIDTTSVVEIGGFNADQLHPATTQHFTKPRAALGLQPADREQG